MHPDVLLGSLRVERLASSDAVRRAAGALLGDGAAPDAGGATGPEGGLTEGGLAIWAGGRPLLVLGLRRESPSAGFGLGRLRTVVVGPVLVAAPDDAPGGEEMVSFAVRTALRELFVGDADWHVLRIAGLPDQATDAAWRFGTRLGHPCTIDRELPPERSADGVVAGTPPVITFYSSRLKGRWARAADAGVLAMLGGAARERAATLAARVGRRGQRPQQETGSRFFALQLAAVPAVPSWGTDVTFREVAEAEAAAEPLRYSTSVRRMEEALRRGDRCFATLVGGVLAHHHWVSQDAEFLGRMLPARALDRPTAYPFDSYTFPAFRGRGLQGVTHHWLALRYREEGVEQFAVRVSSFNSASMKGILKVGYSELRAGDDDGPPGA